MRLPTRYSATDSYIIKAETHLYYTTRTETSKQKHNYMTQPGQKHTIISNSQPQNYSHGDTQGVQFISKRLAVDRDPWCSVELHVDAVNDVRHDHVVHRCEFWQGRQLLQLLGAQPLASVLFLQDSVKTGRNKSVEFSVFGSCKCLSYNSVCASSYISAQIAGVFMPNLRSRNLINTNRFLLPNLRSCNFINRILLPNLRSCNLINRFLLPNLGSCNLINRFLLPNLRSWNLTKRAPHWQNKLQQPSLINSCYVRKKVGCIHIT